MWTYGFRRRHWLICTVGLLFLTGVRTPADFEAGKNAYQQGDYATALHELTPLAEHGNAGAQVFLGKLYMQGRGAPKDIIQAIKWFQAAAEQGNAEGQFFLGGLYLMGGPVAKDVSQGLNWLELSADQGLPDAEVLLGMTYLKGQDVVRDLIQADVFLRLAAAHGDPLAPRMLLSAEKSMTADQLSKARELAATWKAKPAAKPASNPEK
jgi:uncharacterized protein